MDGSRCIRAILFLSLAGGAADAASRYVRADASGSKTGADWADAWTALPSKLVRGDTYYIADGSYGSYEFSDATSGTQVITIKKATASDHGTSSGWSSSYGDGVATFTSLVFTKGYYVFDGARGSSQGTYGFEIYFTGGANTSIPIVKLEAGVTDITLRYTNIHRPSRDHKGDCFYAVSGGNARINLSRCYLHDVHGVHIYFIGVDGATLDHCVFARNKSTAEWHSESIQARGTDNMTVRYCWFEDIEGTAYIVSGSGDSSYWDIHGNVFYATPGYSGGCGHGTVADNFNGSIHHVTVCNNTFVSLKGNKAGARFWNQTGSCVAYNNLYYECEGVGYVGTSHDYDSYYDCEFSGPEYSKAGHDAIVTGNPFADWRDRNVHLSRATAAGKSDLGSKYAKDPDGESRGADGVWDRGAYEYGGGGGGGDPTVPDPPTNVRIRP